MGRRDHSALNRVLDGRMIEKCIGFDRCVFEFVSQGENVRFGPFDGAVRSPAKQARLSVASGRRLRVKKIVAFVNEQRERSGQRSQSPRRSSSFSSILLSSNMNDCAIEPAGILADA